MILYQLHCDQNHQFEGWFKNSEAYDTQAARRLVSCPICNSITVDKAPMAPRVLKGNRSKANSQEETAHDHGNETITITNAPSAFFTALAELRKTIEANSENVGDRFSEEARRIHYGEAKRRSIHGEASLDDLQVLDEEGIDVAPLPWATRYDA